MNMTSAAFPRTEFGQAGMAMSAMTTPLRQACAVRLIERRTGKGHHVNGSPLVLYTRRPDEAAAELLEGRDAAIWETRIEPLGLRGRP
jgi:hypothetical protein